jgi:hypothetical protein
MSFASELVNKVNNKLTSSIPSKAGLHQGLEKRDSVLTSVAPVGIGFFGSPYSAADDLQTPPEIGVRAGDSMESVADAVAGVAYYIDQIGFGQSSTGLTNNDRMKLRPLGVNYFLKTGIACSNGAEMYEYIQGITEGNALGDHVAEVMQEMGLPALKGLAPGMIEDAERALNPEPLMNSLFGSGYPQCVQMELPVGNSAGQIQSPDGVNWISDPDSAYQKNGMYYQKQWVQATDNGKINGNPINLNRSQWESTPKIYNFDGTPKSEGFQGYITHPASMITIGVLCILAYAVVVKRR